MINKLKIPLISLIPLALCTWIGYGIFNYCTHATPPQINLKGIEHNGSYARTTECSIASNNDYKVANISVVLDDKVLFSKRVKSRKFDVPFAIDTTTLQDGPHMLEVHAVDSSYNSNETRLKYQFFVDNTPLQASFLQHEYSVDQGKTLHMKIQANKQLASASVVFLSNKYNFYPEAEHATLYECFIPIDCEEQPTNFMISTDLHDRVGNNVKLTNNVTIKQFEFKKQRGFAIKEEKLQEEKEISMSTKILNEAMEKWLPESPQKKLWHGNFDYPIEVQRMTTPFGEVRVTPERGRHMHKGVDLINRPKCVVWAAQDGKVIIKDRYFLTGNTVVVDHGIGIFTLYAHLDEFADLEVGQTIKRGNPVGKLGMTGYATGYHLHWELRINNIPVDPIEWTSKTF